MSIQLIIFLENDSDHFFSLDINSSEDISFIYQAVATNFGLPLNSFSLVLNENEKEIIIPFSNQSVTSFNFYDGMSLLVRKTTPIPPNQSSIPPIVTSTPSNNLTSNTTESTSSVETPSLTSPLNSLTSTVTSTFTENDIASFMKMKPDALLQLSKKESNLINLCNASQYKSLKMIGKALAEENIAGIRSGIMMYIMENHKKDLDRQKEERDKQEIINENLINALETLPEAFAPVTMLYINIEINGHPIKAFVDSGAQSSIITLDCAKECGIDHLIDTRYHSIARGVGSAKILGQIHILPMKFGTVGFYPISVKVLESGDVKFLLGLDMLKRHRCSIDLYHNVLRIGEEDVNDSTTINSNGYKERNHKNEIPFLSEWELPKNTMFHPNHEENSNQTNKH